ncbi:hypothetical protein VST7929_01120 [Vibrio stylophorae]|uniref:Biotin/lipoyl-binding protein n=1 Tax=Vibrio stylophorae TaxID=659351 RepID=A0ABM8ZSI3_9VIBR|nr:biotin/lipoyl-binding protein [Vibrio stylophorae]CAH0533256.1 hypothetical protein VST7929_01120 [Vibrio stylophorae]
MKYVKPLAVTVVLVFLVSWVGYSFYRAYLPQPTLLQGEIEMQEYSISSKVAGRIDQVLVRKGDTVSKGELIFTIHSPEIEAKLEQAQAGEQAASAMAEQADQGARKQEIQAAKAQWQKASAAAALLKKTYIRVNNLYEQGVIAEQKRDEAKTQWQAAQYTANAAYQMYTMAKEGARVETKKAAQEKVRMAQGAVAEVEAYAKDTQIHSWYQGEVSQVLLHGGELAPQGFPVVTVVDTQDAWAVLHVREDRLNQFRKGQLFEAFMPALNQTVQFKVTHVAVMGDFATWRATDASKGFDLRTFEVQARPVDKSLSLRMGMSVVVTLSH